MHLPEKSLTEHYENLYKLQDDVLAIIDRLSSGFYLGGGTALSRFCYNHRYSDDLDFFFAEGNDFVREIQVLREKLVAEEFKVETFGFSERFARFSVTDSRRTPVLPLKVDFLDGRSTPHFGNFRTTAGFSKVDNPRNILAEKLSYIYQKSPKDIADIWIICKNLVFEWGTVIEEADRKRSLAPLFAAEILNQFNVHELERIRWIKLVRLEDFEHDREIIIKNIIAKECNELISL